MFNMEILFVIIVVALAVIVAMIVKIGDLRSIIKDINSEKTHISSNFREAADKSRDYQNKAALISEKYEHAEKEISHLLNEVRKVEEEKEKVLSQRKSSEVRLGKDSEVLAPFLESFKWDPRQAHFLGMPLDYIIFGDDEITFVEIKSGDSKLSSDQIRLRNIIEKGKVKFEILRVNVK